MRPTLAASTSIRMAQYRIPLQNLGWRGKIGIVVAAALGVAAAIALVIVSLGLALILIPVVGVAMIYGRWRLRRMMADLDARRAANTGDGRTIEIDYTVLDKDGRPRR